MHAIDGIHHISLITGDAPRNVDFYARVLGLRLVKRTVNQDEPGVYHLFYADEQGTPGADITFFEYPGARRGSAGAGMVRAIVHRVASEEALDFWAERLAGEDLALAREPGRLRFSDREPGRLRFCDPEGVNHELAVLPCVDPPLLARSPEVPPGYALRGFEAVRALVADPARSEALLRQSLGFAELAPEDWEARGERRGGRIVFERSAARGVPGAGTVHHVAWSVRRDEQERWRERVLAAGLYATPIIDRFYFESVYFREPSGILFELATSDGAGYTVDEDAATLGERLSLPPRYEPLRERIEAQLTPLPDIRRWRPGTVART